MSGSETSARLVLPLLAAGQAQKETTHNEALTLLDLAVQPSVVALGLNVPPADPAVGDAWVVGAAPGGAWAGHARAIAGWTAGGWRFVAAIPGLAVWSRADGVTARFVDGDWDIGTQTATRLAIGGRQVVGARRDAIPGPVGGATIDVEARGAIAGILQALRGHGLIAG